MRRRTVVFVILAFLVWAVLATGMAGYYYLRFAETMKAFEEIKSSIIAANILIDYGNGTMAWYNETELMAGSTVFDALMSVTANVEYDTSPYGKLITSVNGKEGGENSGWIWLLWNNEAQDWSFPPEAVDEHILHPDDIVKFEYISW